VQRQIAVQQKILLRQILYQCQGQVSALGVPNTDDMDFIGALDTMTADDSEVR
jgi:hypothetical protein